MNIPKDIPKDLQKTFEGVLKNVQFELSMNPVTHRRIRNGSTTFNRLVKENVIDTQGKQICSDSH